METVGLVRWQTVEDRLRPCRLCGDDDALAGLLLRKTAFKNTKLQALQSQAP